MDESWRFAITAFLIARTFYAAWSWVVLTVQPVAVHYVEAEEKPAVLFLNLHTNQIHTYLRSIEGNQLTFRSAGRNLVTDLQTGSIWNIDSGKAGAGFYEGQILTLVKSPEDMFSYFSTQPYPVAWLALWQRFDANWYTSIAQQGYGRIKEDIHFPPLYPLLINITTPIFGNPFIAGLVIAHLATLYTIRLLLNLYNQWGIKPIGRQTVFYFLVYPTSFFLFSAYTESLFLVMVLLALHYMKNQSWGWAGFWTFCAVLTRLQGAALFMPMAYLMWKDSRFLRNPHHWSGAAIAAAGPVFYIYLRSTLAVASIIPLNEPNLYARLVPPWTSYMYALQTLLSGRSNHVDLLNWFVFTLFSLLLVIGWHKIPLEYNLFALASLLITITRLVHTQPLVSMSRYSLTIFPVFYILSMADQFPLTRRVIIYTFITLNLYLSAEFFGWGFVA